MIGHRSSLLAVLLLSSAAGQEPVPTDAPPSSDETAAPLRIEFDDGSLFWDVPRGESLTYEVEVDIGVLGSPQVGTMLLESGVRPYNPGVMVGGAAGEVREMGWFRASAAGEHPLYKVENVIETTYLPQEFPAVFYRQTQTGSENRRKQLKLGVLDGERVVWSRNDGHCRGCKDRLHFLEGTFPWDDEHHCGKCKRGEHRVWRDPKVRPAGPRAVDMMTAVLVARATIASGEERVAFQVADRKRVWDIEVRRSRTKRLKVPAGKFDAVLLELSALKSDADAEDEERFQMLFGLHGTIEIWVEANTGVPLLITGDVPAGPITVGVLGSLRSFEGVPGLEPD